MTYVGFNPTPIVVDSIGWYDLEREVRAAVEQYTGSVRAARTARAGRNSAVATVLDTDRGPVFLKGPRRDHPGVVTQRREAAINPHRSAQLTKASGQDTVRACSTGQPLTCGRSIPR
jgi:hypothetical protein